MAKKQNNRRLSKRDWCIINHVARYRLSTKETLHRLFFNDKEPSAVTKVVSRLCDEGWLRKFPLVYPRQYLLPGKRSVNALGLPNARCLPMGPQSLPSDFAVLVYATSETGIQRLTTQEITALFPWYRDEWSFSPHTSRQLDGASTLEVLRIDLGGPADHVARKCYRDIFSRHKDTAFRKAIDEKLVRLVVITATTDKAAAIQLSLRGHQWPSSLGIHLSVIPDLLPILPRCHDAT